MLADADRLAVDTIEIVVAGDSAARRADVPGLPPAWIGVGTCGLFLDEDRDFDQRSIA